MDGDFDVRKQEEKKQDFWTGIGISIFSVLLYLFTISPGLYPGESAQLSVIYTGLTPPPVPLHPLFAFFVKGISSIPLFSLSLRLNFFSLLCVSLSVWMLFRCVSHFTRILIQEEFSLPYARKASYWAGTVAAVACMTAAPVWHAATRLQFQSFDLFLVLVCFSLLVSFSRSQKGIFLILFGLLWGMGAAESVHFITMSPLFLAFLIYVFYRAERLSATRVILVLVLALLGFFGLHLASAATFLATVPPDTTTLASIGETLFEVWKLQVKMLKNLLPPVGWLIFLLFSTAPFLVSLLASFRALNNERTISQYLLHFALFVAVVLNVVNAPFSPWGTFEPLGRLPVASAAMNAVVAGYLAAYFYLLMHVGRAKRGAMVTSLTKAVGNWEGLLLFWPLLIVVVLSSIVNLFTCNGKDGAFADRCATEILSRMGTRTWFVSNGLLDPHLLFAARERKQNFNLLMLTRDMDPLYRKQIEKKMENQKVFSEDMLRTLRRSLELGLLPFIQDWMLSDPDVAKKMVVFNVPDFWYSENRVPVAEYLFFSASNDLKKDFAGKKILPDYLAFWAEMEKILPVVPETGRLTPVQRFRAALRRHVGFVANNLGVMLQDLGQNADAFATYQYVHQKIDPKNISALFNLFEMARTGVPEAKLHKEAIEREMKDFVSNLKRSYPLWSLSRYFGYVRSPEIFARLGWGWALSGQPGAALAGVTRASKLLAESASPNATAQTIAAIYALSDEKEKSAAVYEDLIKKDPKNRTALLGLAQLSLHEGNLDSARSWLEKATKTTTRADELGVEKAVIHLLNNDFNQARVILQRTTDLQPKNLQAWSMLSLIQLQQGELDELERVTLPRMQKIAGTVNNYFIQVTRGSVAAQRIQETQEQIRKLGNKAGGPDSPIFKRLQSFRKQAREGYINASRLRPDVVDLKNRILSLDIALNDQVAAELHARQVLRQNRKHSLANYVMGSLRLQEGQYGQAEDFLRESVSGKNPPASALNDLAEVLRRIKRYGEAERFARQAVAANPNLYVAWETLASVLMERGVQLNEAEECVLKSIKLFPDDLRVKMTHARIILKKGEVERARKILIQLKSRKDELSPFEQDELDKLMELALGSRK